MLHRPVEPTAAFFKSTFPPLTITPMRAPGAATATSKSAAAARMPVDSTTIFIRFHIKNAARRIASVSTSRSPASNTRRSSTASRYPVTTPVIANERV